MKSTNSIRRLTWYWYLLRYKYNASSKSAFKSSSDFDGLVDAGGTFALSSPPVPAYMKHTWWASQWIQSHSWVEI